MVQRSNPPGSPLKLNLALQGGGSHGAFTWGVLDRLLEDLPLQIASVSATSSGAMNALALAQGWQERGADGARAQLDALWSAIAQSNPMSDWMQATQDWWRSSGLSWQITSPLRANPLAALVQSQFDMDAIRAGPIRVHLAATRVRDGRLRVFGPDELTHDVALASACLPQLFPAVVIDGEPYWDGGYLGNPVLEPLLTPDAPCDVLCILVQGLSEESVPRTPRQIDARAHALSFTSGFQRELRDLALRRRELRGRWWLQRADRRCRALRLHVIEPMTHLTDDEDLSRLDVRRGSLQRLRDLGRESASAWLFRHGATLGRRSSFDETTLVAPLSAPALRVSTFPRWQVRARHRAHCAAIDGGKRALVRRQCKSHLQGVALDAGVPVPGSSCPSTDGGCCGPATAPGR